MEQAANVDKIEPIPLIEALAWRESDWETFAAADAETRDKMRREHAETVAKAVDAQTRGLRDNGPLGAVTAIVVTEYAPDAEDEWRYFEDTA